MDGENLSRQDACTTMDQDLFAATRDGLDCAAVENPQIAPGRAEHVPAHVNHRGERAADQPRAERVDDSLDFGQFGHATFPS